jgi:hypothetical protein
MLLNLLVYAFRRGYYRGHKLSIKRAIIQEVCL